MPNLAFFIRQLSAFGHSETGRIVATVAVLIVALLLVEILQRRARRTYDSEVEISRHRGGYVLAKNLALVLAMVIILSIWASKIAGAALSLAAVAGAVLIVSKEFLANLLGSALYAIARPFRIGDFIEIDGVAGRVIDSDMLATTIAVMSSSCQITGTMATIPNSLLLIKTVKNLTATGEYVVNLLPIAVKPGEDILLLKQRLLVAGHAVCGKWHAEAQEHLKRLELRELIDLPSADLKVLLDVSDAKSYLLTLRYTCRPNDRVRVEQEILSRFFQGGKGEGQIERAA